MEHCVKTNCREVPMINAMLAIGKKMFKVVIGLPVLFFAVAGILLTVLGLSCVTIGKYLFMLIDE